MANVRCNHSTKVLSVSRKEYLSGSDTHYGRKQGQVLYCKLFQDYIYELNKIETHQELEIALPTELLEKDLSDNDWELIGQMFEKLVTEKMGYDNVSVAIHYRDETSGRTDNDNLHVHVGYIDRNIIKQDTYDRYQHENKTPYAINLATGKVVKKKDFKEEKANHLRVEVGDVKLNLDLVDTQVMDKFIELSKKRKLSIEEKINFNEIRCELILQATPQAMEYSIGKRMDKGTNHHKRMEFNKLNACNVLNEICKEFELNRTISKYGEYKVKDWKGEIEVIKEQISTNISILKEIKSEVITETTKLKEIKSEWNKFKVKHIDPIKTELIGSMNIEVDMSFKELIRMFSLRVRNKEYDFQKRESELIDKDRIIRYSNMIIRGVDDDVYNKLWLELGQEKSKYDLLIHDIEYRIEQINELGIEVVEDKEQEYGMGI